MIKFGAANLKANKNTVNELNVFPVPDGDTGDNMYMTIRAGTSADGASLSELASNAAHGMLLGARGNSGVILSRIFAGIAKGFAGLESADVRELSLAMNMGVAESYGAVSNPVEGTILSVFKDGVKAADATLGRNDICAYIDAFISETEKSLERTPDLLPILKDAGVVDSGGAGLVYIAHGMKEALTSDTEISDDDIIKETPGKAASAALFDENSVLEYGYCTEFLLRLQNCKTDTKNFDDRIIINYLSSVGDSVVAFREGTIFKAHVHTMHPGDVLNFCQKYGEFLALKIENMTLEHSETKIKNSYVAPSKKKKYGIIAVAAGDGVTDLFRQLGADEVVSGGQSMNPSSEDFIEAFEKVNAEDIFVLPNNKNIFMAAKQAAELFEGSRIHIIPTKDIGEGYMAMSSLDVSRKNASEIANDAAEAMKNACTCMVSKASRDVNEVNAKAGDFIGFAGGTIYSASENRNDAAIFLLDKTGAGSRDVIMVTCGADVPGEEAEALCDALSKKYKMTEIIKINGGQPVYDYIIILQ